MPDVSSETLRPLAPAKPADAEVPPDERAHHLNPGALPMSPFSKILVPVDFLPHSAEAVRRALDLATEHAEVVLFYAYEPGEYPATPGAVLYDAAQLHSMSAKVRARLDAVRHEADPVGRRRISTRIVQGTPVRAIIEAATREPFDLIVMGTHGRTGVGRVVLGSIAEQVMRRAPCPVLTIKIPRAAAIERLSPEPSRYSRWIVAPQTPRPGLRPGTPQSLNTADAPARSYLPPRL
jgi:nucleotide-binding universal stress UspA family protein